MRIYIREKSGQKIKLRIPTALIFNNLTATIATGAIRKHVDFPDGVNLTPAQGRALVRAIRECKRRYPRLNLVEVDSADGDSVRIRL